MKMPNSGWTAEESLQDEVIECPPALDVPAEKAIVAALPTEPATDTDQHTPPACAFCNAEQHLRERRVSSLRGMLDDLTDPEKDEPSYEMVFERADDYDGIIRADYALIDPYPSVVMAFSCHACIEDAEVVDG